MKKIIFLILISQLLISADFSITEELKKIYKESSYFFKVKPISYVVLDDVSKMKNLGEGCDYFNYIETYLVLNSYKKKSNKYIIVQKNGEYCGKFKLKQFSVRDNNKTTLIGLKRKEHYFYLEDAFDEVPIMNDWEKEINIFLNSIE